MTDKPFPPDPDAGYVRHHAEIHADLLKVNLENSELRRSLSETSNPGEPGIEKLLDELDWVEREINAHESARALMQYGAFIAGARWRESTSSISGEEVVIAEAASRYGSPQEIVKTPQVSSPRLIAARAALVGYVEELRKERDRLQRFETYVCQVIAMGDQARLTIEDLPK